MENMVKEIPHSVGGRRPSFWKRKFLVDARVQLKVIFLLGGIALVSAIAVCVTAYERLMKLSVLFNNSIVPPVMLPKVFEQIALSLMMRLMLIVFSMVIVFIFVGVFLTHQLAGPIWKAQAQLRKFFKGEPIPPMFFRKGDAFQDFPELLNKLINGYNKKNN